MSRHSGPRYPHRTTWVVAAAAVAAGVAVAAGGQQPSVVPPEPASAIRPAEALTPQQDPDEFARVGEALTTKLCSTDCHNLDKVFTVRRASGDWDRVIREMSGRGIVATPMDMNLVQRYLTWSFGYVAVNSAPPGELADVIGIPLEQAEAIVTHREAHGRFADLEALSRVPGVDTATLELQLYALYFD